MAHRRNLSAAVTMLILPTTVSRLGTANNTKSVKNPDISRWGRHRHDQTTQNRVGEVDELIEVNDPYSYVGCFKEDWYDRALTEYGFQYDLVTIQYCYEDCQPDGSTFIALINGNECWCGWGSQEDYTKNGVGDCSMPCSGDSSERCGGYAEFDLYRLNTGGTVDWDSGTHTYASPTSEVPSPTFSSAPEPTSSTTSSGMPSTYSTSDATDEASSSPEVSWPTSPSPAEHSTSSSTASSSMPSTSVTYDATQDTSLSSRTGGGNCDPNPCENGGSCSEDMASGYNCLCATGFGGINCQVDTTDLPPFSIKLEYIGTWTDERKNVFGNAANRWSEVISHVPCGGTFVAPPGELLITAELKQLDGPGGLLGQAGPDGIWFGCQAIAYSGSMQFDLADIYGMELDGSFEGVILHEMGHVIGIGTLWGECSSCRTTGSAEWTCPAAIQAFNDLQGTVGIAANIVELEGGEGTKCGHFSENLFDDEIMTGYVSYGSMPISKMTVAALEDIGYIINPSMVDEYVLPKLRPQFMRVYDDAHQAPFELNEALTPFPVVVTQEGTGEVVEVLNGVGMRF